MDKQLEQYMRLFRGRTDAYGTGKGQWIKRAPTSFTYNEHIQGKGPGLGIAPLLDDGRVWFAAVDLDEPNFDAAKELQDFLSFDGTAWIERSRSGNAHVWVFFDEPIDAWIPRGIMKEAIAAVGKQSVEIFPKQDKLLEGMYGNYINLPYHGVDRPIHDGGPEIHDGTWLKVEEFLEQAITSYNSVDAWKKRANWLMIAPPDERTESAQFGTGRELHMCAEWIIANRDEHPVEEGHRNAVYFSLAKMLCHYEGFGDDECWEFLTMVRDSADEKGVEHVADSELKRIFNNARRGEFTSTGCDDPLVQPYAHPDCPIAKGLR